MAAVFEAELDDAFSVEDLVDRVFHGVNRVEKKHRVSLIRAAKRTCARLDWTWWKAETAGGTLVFFNRYSVMSYGTARLKADVHQYYRTNDPRLRHMAWLIATPKSIRERLEPGGKSNHLVVEGGPWWRHVQINIADRDGDQSERAVRLREEQARVHAAYKADAARLATVLAGRRRAA
ncbi:hypothetical protein [Mesorhizobium sp. IMUNJ 23232]|uniref:hypothetical protein n=1 Tax=Mesorhizobium sp. IMUNJ 23232 TaxID=3376064 RepID=UPI0037A4FC2F